MLMLTRQRGESVDIVDRDTQRVIATVKVLEFIPGVRNSVRLGFDADHSIQFKRDNIRNDEANGNREQDNGEGENEGTRG